MTSSRRIKTSLKFSIFLHLVSCTLHMQQTLFYNWYYADESQSQWEPLSRFPLFLLSTPCTCRKSPHGRPSSKKLFFPWNLTSAEDNASEWVPAITPSCLHHLFWQESAFTHHRVSYITHYPSNSLSLTTLQPTISYLQMTLRYLDRKLSQTHV